ncbi:MAG: hypothetical protein GXY52_05960 [Chloroflexi bacterium]|nr:hypothetical protein [Chloroflexota bacterium]
MREHHDVLLVDSGNTLFGIQFASDTDGKALLEAMNDMHYDAMAIGALELSEGLEAFKGLQEAAEFPLLSANLVDAKGELLTEPYTIVTKNGLRVAVIGVSEPSAVLKIHAPMIADQADTRDAAEAVRSVINTIGPQADLFVVLSRQGLRADRDLAAAVPTIDVIIGGSDRTLMSEPETVGSTVIVQQGYQGEWVGHTCLEIDRQHIVVKATTEAVALTSDYADDPAMLELIKRWNAFQPPQ